MRWAYVLGKQKSCAQGASGRVSCFQLKQCRRQQLSGGGKASELGPASGVTSVSLVCFALFHMFVWWVIGV